MPFYLVRNDITRMETDAIVNAANENLVHGGGVAAAIADAAGRAEMDDASARVAPCPTGSAAWTPGFALPARYVIHAVGPVWRGGEQGEAALLERTYHSALDIAARLGCRSVAFPLISSGIFGFPQDEAFQIAVDAIESFLEGSGMDVYLVLFGSRATEMGLNLDPELDQFIDDAYAQARSEDARSMRLHGPMPAHSATPPGSAPSFGTSPLGAPPPAAAGENLEATCTAAAPLGEWGMFDDADVSECLCAPVGASQALPDDLGDFLAHLDSSFSDAVFALIDAKGLTDPQVYKRVHMSRQAFAKLRQPGYHPKKPTAIVLAIALELDYQQTQELLARAGYTLSASSMQDRVVEFFIRHGVFDLAELNHALWERDLPLLSQ